MTLTPPDAERTDDGRKELVDRLRGHSDSIDLWSQQKSGLLDVGEIQASIRDALAQIEADGKLLAETSEAAGKATYDLARRLGSASARVAALEDGPRPFVLAYERQDSDIPDNDLDNEQPKHLTVDLGDLRRARTLLANQTPTGKEDVAAVVDQVITADPDKAVQAKEKPALAGWFAGEVMKALDGKADHWTVNAAVEARLFAEASPTPGSPTDPMLDGNGPYRFQSETPGSPSAGAEERRLDDDILAATDPSNWPEMSGDFYLGYYDAMIETILPIVNEYLAASPPQPERTGRGVLPVLTAPDDEGLCWLHITGGKLHASLAIKADTIMERAVRAWLAEAATPQETQ